MLAKWKIGYLKRSWHDPAGPHTIPGVGEAEAEGQTMDHDLL